MVFRGNSLKVKYKANSNQALLYKIDQQSVNTRMILFGPYKRNLIDFGILKLVIIIILSSTHIDIL